MKPITTDPETIAALCGRLREDAPFVYGKRAADTIELLYADRLSFSRILADVRSRLNCPEGHDLAAWIGRLKEHEDALAKEFERLSQEREACKSTTDRLRDALDTCEEQLASARGDVSTLRPELARICDALGIAPTDDPVEAITADGEEKAHWIAEHERALDDLERERNAHASTAAECRRLEERAAQVDKERTAHAAEIATLCSLAEWVDKATGRGENEGHVEACERLAERWRSESARSGAEVMHLRDTIEETHAILDPIVPRVRQGESLEHQARRAAGVVRALLAALMRAEEAAASARTVSAE